MSLVRSIEQGVVSFALVLGLAVISLYAVASADPACYFPGDSCVHDSDCCSHLCEKGSCSHKDAVHFVGGRDPGWPCEFGPDCKSGFCDNGQCG